MACVEREVAVCGSCETGHSARRWSSTRVTLLVFVATLLALSAAGVVMKVRPSQPRAVGSCATASSAAVRFQSAVTNDLGNHDRLHADTQTFAREIRTLDAITCAETVRFLGTAKQTLGALCPDCVGELRRVPSRS